MAATNFFGGAFFGGEFYDSAPLPIIDTHDGGDRKRYDEKFRDAQARRRQQLADAFSAPVAASEHAVALPGVAARSEAAAQTPFNFDADDEEIILLL